VAFKKKFCQALIQMCTKKNSFLRSNFNPGTGALELWCESGFVLKDFEKTFPKKILFFLLCSFYAQSPLAYFQPIKSFKMNF
jgi:hypothetical protein